MSVNLFGTWVLHVFNSTRESRVDHLCRYGRSEVTGGRYGSRRDQEEEEAEPQEDEDAQETMAAEEAQESRKG